MSHTDSAAESSSPASLFIFRFRLLPEHACTNINFEGLQVFDVGVACTRDLLGVQLETLPGDVRPLLLAAKAHAAILLDVHAFCAYPHQLPPLDLVSEGWIEVREGAGKTTVFGCSDPSLESHPLVTNHPDNRPFFDAQQIVTSTLRHVPDLEAAFSDFRAARRQSGSYVAFYANRVLEDIGLLFGRDADGHRNWSSMNVALASSKAHWRLLTDESAQSRHNPLAPISDAKRKALLDLAKEAIDKYIAWQNLQTFASLTKSTTTTIFSGMPN